MSIRPSLPAGYALIELDGVDSTNEEALRRVRDGAGAGTAVIARSQNLGRGRKGAAWHSPPGNLHASLVVAPPEERAPGQLAFVAAVAAGEAVRRTAAGDLDLRYKWPNDLMLDGRKLGGILIEGAPRRLYVLGIGVNLVAAPADARAPATHLGEWTTAPPQPLDLLAKFCGRFDHWIGLWRARGFAPVRAAWLERASGIGAAIDARLAAETVRGVFADMDESGALILVLPDGTRRAITAGAVYFPSREAAACC